MRAGGGSSRGRDKEVGPPARRPSHSAAPRLLPGCLRLAAVLCAAVVARIASLSRLPCLAGSRPAGAGAAPAVTAPAATSPRTGTRQQPSPQQGSADEDASEETQEDPVTKRCRTAGGSPDQGPYQQQLPQGQQQQQQQQQPQQQPQQPAQAQPQAQPPHQLALPTAPALGNKRKGHQLPPLGAASQASDGTGTTAGEAQLQPARTGAGAAHARAHCGALWDVLASDAWQR
jgi:hypothetical protein